MSCIGTASLWTSRRVARYHFSLCLASHILLDSIHKPILLPPFLDIGVVKNVHLCFRLSFISSQRTHTLNRPLLLVEVTADEDKVQKPHLLCRECYLDKYEPTAFLVKKHSPVIKSKFGSGDRSGLALRLIENFWLEAQVSPKCLLQGNRDHVPIKSSHRRMLAYDVTTH